ncbi:MAG TPA: 50S ribosomal protein L37ae [Candidatus Aenigmarchaeota archaeon]|nr:50S ribosomal protein L37ae [Candidatus Aenigmarchaeota archaeon]
MGRTKKVKSAGRYGVRYGLKLRKKLLEVEKEQKKKHICPNCKKPGLKRLAAGIWYCKKCGAKFAGKAYVPR